MPRPALPVHAALLAALALFALAPAAGAASSHQVNTGQVRAELVAHAPEGVVPGKPLWLGLVIEHAPKWHTYWKNPGDSGLPTTLNWQLPAGLLAGDVDWPTPSKLPFGPLMNFGYEGRLLLPVPVTVQQVPAGDTVTVTLNAEWLVCKDVCIPESGSFTLALPVQAATALNGPLFATAHAARPQAVAGAQAQARVEGDMLVFSVSGLPATWQGHEIDVLPETPGVIQNAARPATAWQDGQWQARVPLDPQRSESPATMPVVLTRSGQAAGLLVQVAVTTPWPTLAAAAATAPAVGDAAITTALPASAPSLSSWAGSLLLALFGGLLLNLMPCVFPVLSLKVFGFASHAHDRRGLLAGGLAYTAGVVLSFVALAALLLALRAGGEQLGWGFQLQSPGFVAALAALFTLIGLNLAGAFEFGALLPARWLSARARHPVVDSALTGVLAVAVASPCTAPFMGASLGAAVTMPAAQALSVFAALGLGMALPYLLASAWPGLARLLPRPGPWMAHFKALMAFPMFATVVWLVWVLGQQAGIDGAAALLGALVALAFVAWALGAPGLGARARTGFGALSALLLALVLAWALPALRPVQAVTLSDTARWQPWSPEKVAELGGQGRPVFVDFTAAWCVTCQYNKRTTLADAEVLQAFDAQQVALLRADWTLRDARITAELARLGRSGVPVYALYAPGAQQPQLLGEILGVAEVKQALAGLR
ncbi:protein-disulfide reductase DsbD family protein [Pseudorhodoferax sp.]|uniref:protein-disulfide reductase DsbD family protein n=1 Tax=Pseudorhodoferax sp. TaxID=1993553 RepID=UPI002DD64509|nr:thioredoxin family protein [Pseudorhodoferax sp.]